MKRYIASDFHNGNVVSDYDRVMAFLDLVDDDADEFLILGDFEELVWSNMTILTTVKPYKYITDKVKAIAQKKPVSYVIGNHDWSVGFFASQIEPVKIISPFAENGVYYTHGHEWDWLAFVTGNFLDPIFWKLKFPFFVPTQLFVSIATKQWATAEDTYHWGISIVHEQARRYAEKHGYHIAIFGHTHYPVDEVRGGIRLVNVGDHIDSYSYAIIEENGRIELKYF